MSGLEGFHCTYTTLQIITIIKGVTMVSVWPSGGWLDRRL